MYTAKWLGREGLGFSYYAHLGPRYLYGTPYMDQGGIKSFDSRLVCLGGFGLLWAMQGFSLTRV